MTTIAITSPTPAAIPAATPTPIAEIMADCAHGDIIAVVNLPVSPTRVFPLLASSSVTEWWVRPATFVTREWSGDVRAGGSWRVSGLGREQPFVLEGDFLEVDAPRRLVHTWRRGDVPIAASTPPTTVTYDLESSDNGTRLTLRHTGFVTPDVCAATAAGWQGSLDALVRLLVANRD